MEPTTTGAPAPEPTASTGEQPITTAPASSTPNPVPVDGGQPNPQDGTGVTPQAPAMRNTPEGGAPEGYVATDKFNASRDEALRLNDLVKSLGYDPKTGNPFAPAPQAVAPATPTPTQPLTVQDAAQQIPGFSSLSPQEQAMVINPRQAYQDVETLKRQVAEMYDRQQTDNQIKELTAKDEYKDLDKDAFREFIYREDNLGVQNMDTLAKMFAMENQAPAPTPTPEGGESTTAGAKEIAPGSGITEVTPDEATKLRKEDPRRYAQLVQSKKLRIVNE